MKSNPSNQTNQSDQTDLPVAIDANFESFGLKDTILKGLKEAGFKVPSPIQQKVIPSILEGCDMIGQAHTGTGKTAAFGLPALSLLEKNKGVELLVITPTRELATQVSDELFLLGSFAGIKTATVYGGRSFSGQLEMIRRGAQVVVATPGRLLDMLQSNRLPNFKPSIVVLDEADEMLDMGFLDDIKAIFTFLPKKRQTLLFSATMPVPIQKLAAEILNNPMFVSVTQKETSNKDIKQHYYIIEEHERDDAVVRLIDFCDPEKSVIFCRTRKEVDRVGTALVSKGYLARGLHGEMEQNQREEVIGLFRAGKIDILVATDVAARGLNVVDISHVFNYHIPFDPESYVHRIGRTARGGRKGMAITLVTPKEYRDLQRICKTVGTTMTQSIVPSLSDVKKIQDVKLIEEIKHQQLDADASRILSILEEDIDLTQISCKLISMLLNRQIISGPEQIGIDQGRIERLIKQGVERNERPGGSGNRRSRGGFGRKTFSKGKSNSSSTGGGGRKPFERKRNG